MSKADSIVTAFAQKRGVFKRNGDIKVVNNTSSDGYFLKLHRNIIAKWDGDTLLVSNAGWNTPTTRDRLNGIPGVSATTRRGQAYLNGLEWDGKWMSPVEAKERATFLRENPNTR